MHDELQECLEHLLGSRRAHALLLEVARRRGVSWPPSSPAELEVVHAELEQLPAVPPLPGTYDAVIAILVGSVEIHEATTAIGAALEARGLCPAEVDLRVAAEILDELALRPDALGRAASKAWPRATARK